MELKSIAAWRGELESGNLDPALQRLYGADSFGAPKLRQRFLEALEGFEQTFPERTLAGLFSAPGRTEIGGNHTDHQLGWVLGAAVSLDVIGVVSPREDNVIRVQSQGYRLEEVDLSRLEPVPGRTGNLPGPDPGNRRPVFSVRLPHRGLRRLHHLRGDEGGRAVLLGGL